MFKRVISTMVGVACLLSMTGVFAASHVSTTTVYTNTDKIRVQSKVTGNINEVATYLVTESGVNVENLTKDQVVYVDQYEFTRDGDEYTFDYVTTAENLGATVLFGDDITEDATDNVGEAITVNGSTVYVAPFAKEGSYTFIPVASAAGQTVASITRDGTELDKEEWFSAVGGVYVADVEEEQVYTITMTSTQASECILLDAQYVGAGDMSDPNDEYDDTPSILAAAKVVGDYAEYGVVVCKNQDFTGTEGTDIFHFKALGKNEKGGFAVRWYTDLFKDDTASLYVTAYTKTGDAYSYDTARIYEAKTGKDIKATN